MKRTVRPLTRDHVRESVDCPKCGAAQDEECFDKPSASRDANHIERVKHAVEVLHWEFFPVVEEEPDYAPHIDDFRRGGWRP